MTRRELLLSPGAVRPDPGPRRQHGLAALHTRMVRRAETLVADPSFREAIRETRERWNAAHPRWRVRPSAPLTASGLPDTLERDAADEIAAFYARGEQARASLRQDQPVPDTIRAGLDAALCSPEVEGRIAWGQLIDELVNRYFPTDNYPVPGAAAHPTERFIEACLHADTDVLAGWGDAEITPLMRVPSWRVEARGGGDVVLVLPPGVTADDIRRHADAIAAAANRHHAHRQPAALARRLRDEGASMDAIAEALGMAKATVYRLLTD